MGLFFCEIAMNVSDFYERFFLPYPVITTDSRNVPVYSLFFALKGENFNGNLYAIDAIQKGAAFAIVDDSSLSHPSIVYVENVLVFLQELAKFHRSKLSIPVIGITGSNGKTTTKELITAVLAEVYSVTSTKGNLNNHIGVPLSILSIPFDAQIAVIEMGANHIGEIGFLCEISQPDFGIITNVGKAHLEGFGTFENIITTKTDLYRSVMSRNGTLFVDADNEILLSYSQNSKREFYSLHQSDSSMYGISNTDSICASFTLYTKTDTVVIDSQLFGEYNVKNMLAAACIGMYFNVPLSNIKHALESYTPSNNRSQIFKTSKNTLILDAYNANPSSMSHAIAHFESIQHSAKIAILGEMYELGQEHEKEHAAIQDLILSGTIQRVFFIGNWPLIESDHISFFSTTVDLITFLKEQAIANSLFLIKGSRGVKLESVVPYL